MEKWEKFTFWEVVHNEIILTNESQGMHEDTEIHLLGLIAHMQINSSEKKLGSGLILKYYAASSLHSLLECMHFIVGWEWGRVVKVVGWGWGQKGEIVCNAFWDLDLTCEFIKTQVHRNFKIKCSKPTDSSLTSFYLIFTIRRPGFWSHGKQESVGRAIENDHWSGEKVKSDVSAACWWDSCSLFTLVEETVR